MSSAWETAYSQKSESERSWTQSVPADSLGIIDAAGLDRGSAVIDIGGGASYLVDELVERGFTDVTLLDISPGALDESRSRNGNRVSYVAADVTTWRPARTFAMWHDRAVFHFLTTPEQQAGYVRALLEGTTVGSHLVIATFALDGPDTCSGLPVRRWSAGELIECFAGNFESVSHAWHLHTTPWGATQPFTFVHLVRRR